MIPEQLTSIAYPFAQSHSGDLVLPAVRQHFLRPDATIDPLLLLGESHEPFPHHDSSSNSPYRFEGTHYHHPSPDPSTSAGDWMGLGYSDYEAVPASAPSHISPTMSYRDVPQAMFVSDPCVCGCGKGPCIPQREYDRQRTDPLSSTDLQQTILFKVNGDCGYPLEDALKKRYTGLDGRDDKMFVDFKSSISIRLEWLPYDKWTKQIRTLTWKKNAEHITRAKLATEVAKRMKIFFEEMQDKPANPSHLEYRVQPGIIDFDHLELVALKRVAKSSYMPHFRSIPPSGSL